MPRQKTPEGPDIGPAIGHGSRAARGLLRWSLRDLAERSNVSRPTLHKMENGGKVSDDTEGKVHSTFGEAGVGLFADDADLGGALIVAPAKFLAAVLAGKWGAKPE